MFQKYIRIAFRLLCIAVYTYVDDNYMFTNIACHKHVFSSTFVASIDIGLIFPL